MRAQALLLLLVAGCWAEPRRSDPAGLIERLADPDDGDVERLLVEGGREAERTLEQATAKGPPLVRLRARSILRQRENRRLGPVEFLADGAPTACDADGENRRPGSPRAREEPPKLDGIEILGDEFSWSPDRRWAAVATRIDGDEEILAVRADGSERRRLTRSPGADRQPAWSPDGRQIAIVTDRDGDMEIYTINFESRFVIRLTWSPGPDHSPRWSADGSTVFFVSERDGRPQIYRAGRDRTNLMRVSDGTADDRF